MAANPWVKSVVIPDGSSGAFVIVFGLGVQPLAAFWAVQPSFKGGVVIGVLLVTLRSLRWDAALCFYTLLLSSRLGVEVRRSRCE